MPNRIANCVVCAAAAGSFEPFASTRGWQYVRCANCGLVLLDPQPTEAELGHFYNDAYSYDRRRYENSIPQQHVWLDALATACGGPGELLEVGCSYGHFLAAARKRGWSVRGIELNRAAAAFAREKLGLAVGQGRILDVLNGGGGAESFDAVVAWHVLEHDPDPRRFVEAAFALLRPGGVLAFRVPNLDSAVARLSGDCWQWLSPPEHVCMYTAGTLSRLLTERSFEVLSTRTLRGNARNMWFEILRARTKRAVMRRAQPGRAQPAFDRPAVYQDRAWYRAIEGIFDVVSMPADWLLSRWLSAQGREAELAMIGRKPLAQTGSAPCSLVLAQQESRGC